MTLGLYLAVAAGGFVGAPARYLLDRAVTGRVGSALPWGTITVNISGSLVLGVLAGLAIGHHLAPIPNALLGTGFCGAYTTFSTFTYETMRLVAGGEILRAGVNVLVSVVVGVLAAAGGLAIGLAV